MTDQEYRVPGRAYTIEDKRIVIERLYAVWCHCNSLRLGQLISNAMISKYPDGVSLFYVEDDQLSGALEEYLTPTT